MNVVYTYPCVQRLLNTENKPQQEQIMKTLAALNESLVTESSFPIYHRQYSSAVDAALAVAKKQGFEVSDDEVFQQISTGPRKPSEGKTNRFTLELTKNGKPVNKTLQVQIYGMGNGSYELNAYVA